MRLHSEHELLARYCSPAEASFSHLEFCTRRSARSIHAMHTRLVCPRRLCCYAHRPCLNFGPRSEPGSCGDGTQPALRPCYLSCLPSATKRALYADLSSSRTVSLVRNWRSQRRPTYVPTIRCERDTCFAPQAGLTSAYLSRCSSLLAYGGWCQLVSAPRL